MGQNSKIEWTDHTFNPWIGCMKVHEGCAHCYAEADMDTRRGRVKWGGLASGGTRSKTSANNWHEPIKWHRDAEKAGRRARVFCASLADVFEEWGGLILDHRGQVIVRPYLESENTPEFWSTADADTLHGDPQGWSPITMHDLRRELFKLIDATPWLDWLLVTKRPENVCKMWPLRWKIPPGFTVEEKCKGVANYRSNVWLLTSVSNQRTFDEQWAHLTACRDLVPVLGLSAEPLLGAIDMQLGRRDDGHAWERHLLLDWVICGGESGNQARPLHPFWARSLRDQCQAAGVAFFFKQWGEFAPVPVEHKDGSRDQPGPAEVPLKNVGKSVVLRADGDHSKFMPDESRPDAWWMCPVGKHEAGRLLDGMDWSQFPRSVTPAAAELATDQRG